MGKSRAQGEPAITRARFRRKPVAERTATPPPGFPIPVVPTDITSARPENPSAGPNPDSTARHPAAAQEHSQRGNSAADQTSDPTARQRVGQPPRASGFGDARETTADSTHDPGRQWNPLPGFDIGVVRDAWAQADRGAAVDSGTPRRQRNQQSTPGDGWNPVSGTASSAEARGTRAGSDSAAAGRGARGRRARATETFREMLAPTGVEPEELTQRLPETLRGMGEQAFSAVRRWADPRERELRRRRRFRRRSLRLGTASGVTTIGTIGLVLISAPAWAVVVVGGGAVALVTGAAVTTKRYLQLRKETLPPAAFMPRKLPPLRSAVRASISRLVRAERAMHGLGNQIAVSGRLPEEDIVDTLETAGSGAAALHALAADVVAMEQAAGMLSQPNSPLHDHIRAATSRLDSGVAEYEQIVTAAARVLAVPESAALADDLGWAMVNLRDAADRLDGWAQALTDLADSRYRATPPQY